MAENKENNRNVNGSLGSNLWKANYFRKDILTSLLQDVYDLTESGLEEQYCKEIRRALEYYYNLTLSVSRTGFFNNNSLGEPVGKFAKCYEEWNKVEGTSSTEIGERRKYYRKLQKYRQEIADSERKMQFELEKNLDLKTLESAYKAFQGVINLVPDTFKNISKALVVYSKKGGTF